MFPLIKHYDVKGHTTALYIAADHGEYVVVCDLLDNGADPMICTDDGASPLFIASQFGNVDVVKRILEHCVTKQQQHDLCTYDVRPYTYKQLVRLPRQD